jgi:DnaK suppressor protein
MDKKHLDLIEARLIAEREHANSSLARTDEEAMIATDDDGDLTRYPLHPADAGTDTIEQETAMVLLTQESERLSLIDAALLRLYKEPETFGKCLNCGQDIPIERLELIPWTQHCLNCQSNNEAVTTGS